MNEDDSFLVQSGEEDGEEEEATAQTVLKSLEEAWLNEKYSPEILPHQVDLVDCMLQQIHQMETNIRALKKGDFRITIHRMELDRIRYVIASYLRTRLEKIETFAASALEQESRRPPDGLYLSAGERRFAEDFLAGIENHFQSLALRHMPSNFKNFDKARCVVAPNLDSHIFLRANRDVTGVIVGGDEDVESLEEGSQHVMQYRAVADLVKAGDVQLI